MRRTLTGRQLGASEIIEIFAEKTHPEHGKEVDVQFRIAYRIYATEKRNLFSVVVLVRIC